MKDNLKSKQKNIEIKKDEFDKTVFSNDTGDEIFKKSIELDNAILDFFKEKIKN